MTEEQQRLNSFHRAKERVQEIKALYTHVVVYLLINPFLIFINYFKIAKTSYV